MTAPRLQRAIRRGWTDAHLGQLASGADHLGHAWSGPLALLHPAHKRFDSLASIPSGVLGEMLTCWRQFGPQIAAEVVERYPGRRAWFAWITELLPVEPLRIVDGGDVDEAKRLCMPGHFHVWQDAAGCESSFAYLLRRGLLLPGELDRIREKESGEHLSAAAELKLNRVAHYRIPVSAHALACAAFILGDDLLTDDEREEAASELALLRSYEEATR